MADIQRPSRTGRESRSRGWADFMIKFGRYRYATLTTRPDLCSFNEARNGPWIWWWAGKLARNPD
jgi:hypothetical protein